MTPSPSIDLVTSTSKEEKDRVVAAASPAADATTVETVTTTAPADNTSKWTPKNDSKSNSKSNNNSMNITTTIVAAAKKEEESDFSKSESVRRARSHWQFVKSVVATATDTERQPFKTGKSSSLTTAEATFLNMITKTTLETDRDLSQRRLHGGGGKGARGGAHFTHLVQAAVAKEKLRDAISARLVNLSSAETKFLTKLVANKNVTLQALENAVQVLDNDPLYNQNLRREDSEYTVDMGDLLDEAKGDSQEDGDYENGGDVAERRPKRNSVMLKGKMDQENHTSFRRSSAIKSSIFFEKALGEATAAAGDGIDQSSSGLNSPSTSWHSVVNTTMQRRRAARRRASVAESSVWNIARGAAAAVKAEEEEGGDDDAPPPPPPAISSAQFGLSEPGEIDILSESVRGSRHENMLDSSVHRTPRGGKRGRRAAATGRIGGGMGLDAGGETGLDASARTSRRRTSRVVAAAAAAGDEVAGGELGLDASTRTSRRRGARAVVAAARGGGMAADLDAGGETGLDASTRTSRRRSALSLDASARSRRRGFTRGGSLGSGSGAGTHGLERGRFARGGSLGSEIGAGSGGGRGFEIDSSTGNRKATTEEKSMWKLVHGDSIDTMDDVNSNAVLEDMETGLPVKSMAAGETMDPLLMACPVERTPMQKCHRKTLSESSAGGAAGDFLSQSVNVRGGRGAAIDEGDPLSQSVRTSRRRGGRGAMGPSLHRRVGSTGDDPLQQLSDGGQKVELNELLASSNMTSLKRFSSGHKRVSSALPPMPALPETHHDHDGDHPEGEHQEAEQRPEEAKLEMEEAKMETVSFVESEAGQDMSNPLAACLCGAEGMSLMENFMKMGEEAKDEGEKSPGAAAAAAEEEGEEVNAEDSLAFKRKYLHLDKDESKAAADEDERRTKLSTWMGAPEDYPILGLGKKRSASMGDDDWGGAGDGSFEDPLEPHVLSPLLMKCLRDHLPFALREENFWLRYSLVRDGASMDVIFDTMRHSQHTVLAIETSHGEVLGSFTSSPWRHNGNNYYGSCEAFVWMLRKSRRNDRGEDSCSNLDEYILRESSLDVFQWNGKGGNRNVQLSSRKKLFVGGGDPEKEEDLMRNSGGAGESKEGDPDMQWGMALALDKELLRGTSSPCATFASNPLFDKSRNEGLDVFEIMNMEIWALTPCMNEEMAEELELGRTFVMGFHSQASESGFQ